MDYTLFTPEIFDERYETMPASLRPLLNSEQVQRILKNIERENYLGPDKSIVLEQLVGLVIMGFIPLRKFSKEVMEQLFLNYEHALILSDEVYNRIFIQYEKELNEIYKPV